MKIQFPFIYALVLMLLASCFNDESVSENSALGKNRNHFKKLEDPLVKAKIMEYLAKQQQDLAGERRVIPHVPGEEPANYDYDNMVVLEETQDGITPIVAEGVSSLIRKRAHGFYLKDGVVISSVKVVNTKLSSTKSKVEYFSADNFFLRGVTLDANAQTATPFGSPAAGYRCGQAVMDCMDYNYTKDGWHSVTITLVTIFVPEVAIGVMAGCALAVC